MTVFERIKKIVIKKFELGDEYTIKMNTSLAGDLGLDSLDIVELTMAIENEFNKDSYDFEISLYDDEVNSLATFGGFVLLVEEKLKQNLNADKQKEVTKPVQAAKPDVKKEMTTDEILDNLDTLAKQNYNIARVRYDNAQRDLDIAKQNLIDAKAGVEMAQKMLAIIPNKRQR